MQKKSTKISVKSTKNVKAKAARTRKNTTKSDTFKNYLIKNKAIEPDLSYMDDDKILKKVEKYVDKNREKTSQEIIERKKNKSSQNYQNADLEVMISRIDAESKPKVKTREISRRIANILYIVIIFTVLIFVVRYVFP